VWFFLEETKAEFNNVDRGGKIGWGGKVLRKEVLEKSVRSKRSLAWRVSPRRGGTAGIRLVEDNKTITLGRKGKGRSFA